MKVGRFILMMSLLAGSAIFSGSAHCSERKMVIDWTNCNQPDRASASYRNKVTTLESEYIKSAREKSPNSHISVALNIYYGQVVSKRRALVAQSYIPVGPGRKDGECALSKKNYEQLLVVRDASYYLLCRSEVAVGTSALERTKKSPKTLAYAAIYDLAKSLGVDLRHKPDEPTTPPGGFAACVAGISDGLQDPFPLASDVGSFKTRLDVPDSEKAKIGNPEKQ